MPIPFFVAGIAGIKLAIKAGAIAAAKKAAAVAAAAAAKKAAAAAAAAATKKAAVAAAAKKAAAVAAKEAAAVAAAKKAAAVAAKEAAAVAAAKKAAAVAAKEAAAVAAAKKAAAASTTAKYALGVSTVTGGTSASIAVANKIRDDNKPDPQAQEQKEQIKELNEQINQLKQEQKQQDAADIDAEHIDPARNQDNQTVEQLDHKPEEDTSNGPKNAEPADPDAAETGPETENTDPVDPDAAATGSESDNIEPADPAATPEKQPGDLAKHQSEDAATSDLLTGESTQSASSLIRLDHKPDSLRDPLTGKDFSQFDSASSAWLHMHHDNGINDSYLDIGTDTSRFNSFLPQEGPDGIIPIAESLTSVASIPDPMTGKPNPMGMVADPLVAGGPMVALQAEEPRNLGL